MDKRQISSLEYKLNQILGRDDLNQDCEPRTFTEENAHANAMLADQLKTFELGELNKQGVGRE